MNRDTLDLGTDGPAMLARRRAFDPEVGADRALDEHPLDALAAMDLLTDRETDAGHELCRLYAMGFGRPRVTASLESRGTELPSEEDEARETGARAAYCRLLELVPRGAQRAVMRMVRGQMPDGELARLAEALGRVAAALRL